MRNQLLIVFIILINCSSAEAQQTYIVTSDDNKVFAEHYIAADEAIDSVIVKSKKSKFTFSYHTPLFDLVDESGYALISPCISVHHVKKVKRNVYMIIGIGGNTNLGTELNIIFVKKKKILKYYVLHSNNKLLRDVSFKYLRRTKEVIIPIPKLYTPQGYIHEININENSLETIEPFDIDVSEKDELYFHYKLKTK